MASEKISHTAVQNNTSPFALTGGIYTASCAGTIADGRDAIELQRLVNGAFVSVDPPARFLSTDKGGSKVVQLPAGQYRWTVSGSGHSVNTSVTG